MLFDVHEPFQLIGVDFCGPFAVSKNGNRFILTIMDFFTRYVQLVPTRDQTARAAADALMAYCSRFGIPRILLSDRGSAFTSTLFSHLCTSMGVRQLQTTAYHPQGNGRTERVHRSIRAAINPRGPDFEDQINAIQFALNTTPHSSHGVTPYELVFNRPATTLLSTISTGAFHQINMDSIRERLKRYEAKYEKRSRDTQNQIVFNPGTLVLKHTVRLNQATKKYSDRFVGPYVVLERVQENVYKLQALHGRYEPEVVNVCRLKRYFLRTSSSPAHAHPFSNPTSPIPPRVPIFSPQLPPTTTNQLLEPSHGPRQSPIMTRARTRGVRGLDAVPTLSPRASVVDQE